MKKISLIIPFIISIFLLISCGKSSVYEQSVKFGNSGWNRFSKLKFDFEIKNSENRYDLFIEAKINDEYQEQYLPLYLKADYSNGEIRTEKYSIKIKDNYNRFLKEKKDNIRLYSECIQRGKKFPKAGIYKYEFEHGTSQLVLSGIEEINFKIVKSDIQD